MRKKLMSQKGSTTIEWLLVVLLLLVFSLSIFVLASSASNRYEALENTKKNDSEIRIATSYLTTKIRQSDAIGSLFIIKRTETQGPALMIEEVLLGETYETWIYVSNGRLLEATIPSNSKLDEDVSFEVAKLESVELEWVDDKGIQISVTGLDGTKRDFFVSLKTLRQ